jgi:hypothetical protein
MLRSRLRPAYCKKTFSGRLAEFGTFYEKHYVMALRQQYARPLVPTQQARGDTVGTKWQECFETVENAGQTVPNTAIATNRFSPASLHGQWPAGTSNLVFSNSG